MSTGSPREFAADCTVIRHGSAGAGRAGRGQAARRGDRSGGLRAAILDGLFGQPGGERIDTIVLACTHFPLVEEELAAAAPAPVAFVDGKAGHRPPHRLADPRPRPGRTRRREGIAVFTGRDTDVEAYRAGLARFGLTRIERL